MTDELGSVLAAAIGPALRRLDAQQPVDIAPGRRRLGDLPVTARSRRPHLLVALATVAALVLVLLVVTLPRGRAVEPVPALRSGLPTGLLVGHVLHRHEDVRPYRALVALRIRPDGGGALVFPLGDRSESFDVQYVGTGPGTVEVRSDSPYCVDRPELVLTFTVRADRGAGSVRLDRVRAGDCTFSPQDAAELTGVVLSRQEDPAVPAAPRR